MAKASFNHTGYVQYGCGLCVPPTWTNFDASPTLRIQRIPLLGPLLTRKGIHFPDSALDGDIIHGLPIAPESCRAVYCSHVLEHLSLEDCRTALHNSFSYLQPGGIFRFVLPDLERIAREYVGSDDPQASIHFMEESLLGSQTRTRRLGSFLRQWLGNSAHLWMWDFRSLSHELVETGFAAIRRATFGDSSEPRFADVEDKHRWDGCLGIECVRPS